MVWIFVQVRSTFVQSFGLVLFKNIENARFKYEIIDSCFFIRISLPYLGVLELIVVFQCSIL